MKVPSSADIVIGLKARAWRSDPASVELPAEAIVAIAGVIALTVLVILYSVAGLARDIQARTELVRTVARMRKEYDDQTSQVSFEEDPVVLEAIREQYGGAGQDISQAA
ncbi:MAG: hypothetical protein KF745_11190 [Phycisphaeraceae bacterium]|nr:hypothetical protein [Phycisphaeraceae bacterium]